MLIKYVGVGPSQHGLKEDNEYIVYGLHFVEDDIIFEILTDESDTYTIEASAKHFKIVDNRLSQFFVLGSSHVQNHMNNPNAPQAPFISFREWANDKYFFERLVEGDGGALQIFDKYKILLTLEFSNSSVKQFAEKIGNVWVQCAVCAETWELEYPTLEMCQCANCHTVLLNPFKDPSK
jgi:hypothetical protein